MSVTMMSVLGAMLSSLIVAFFIAVFSTEKIDLAGRLDRSKVKELVDEADRSASISNTGYGTFYKNVFEKHLGDAGIRRLAGILGMDLDGTQEQIELAGLGEKFSAQELLSMKFLGLCGVVLFGGIGGLRQDIFFIGLGGILFLLGYLIPQNKIKEALKKRNNKIINELPGFIERTYMCMESGANLKQALEMIADSSDGVLGREFKTALTMANYGTGWERELENMASKIQVEALQDFVVDVIMANSKGISVTDTLREEAEHINIIRRANAMETIGRLETKVTMLSMVFSLIPAMGVLMFPLLINSFAFL
ncbi:type II secretion system F family protein (plasmid) [Enterocloster clostridioformis]